MWHHCGRRLLWTLLFASAPALSSAGATYYVDATLGNDGHEGTSVGAAWRTIAKVTGSALVPGDTVLFKRGEQWRENLTVHASGSESQAITFGAYGTGDKPVINGADVVTGWTPAGSNRYSASVPTAPEVVVFGGVMGKRESSLAAVDAARDWYWTGGVLSIYSAESPGGIEASARQYGIGLANKSYVVIRDLTVRYADSAVTLYDSNQVLLDNLSVHDNAGAAGIAIFSSTAGAGTYNTVQHCEVWNTVGSTASLLEENNGNGIFIYGENAEYNTIQQNSVHHNGEEGIVVLTASRNAIRNNTVYQSAQSGIRIGLETATANLVEGNTSYENCQASDDRYGIDLIRVGNDNIVRYNRVYSQYDTLSDPAIPPCPDNGGVKFGTGGIRFDGGNWEGHDHMDSTGNQAYYNVVYNEGWGIESFNFSNIEIYNNVVYGSYVTGIAVDTVSATVSSNNIVKNNAVYTEEGYLVFHLNAINSTFDNNLYYPDAAEAFYLDVFGVGFEAWQSATGQDMASLSAAPLFVDAPGGNFALQAGSPCVDAGADMGLSRDFGGTPVPQGEAVDIGAYELAVPPCEEDTACHVRFAYQVGDNLCLSVPCPVASDSAYQWTKGGVPLEDIGRVQGAAERVLKINGLEMSDSGEYACSYDDGSMAVTSHVAVVIVVAYLPVAGLFGKVLLAFGIALASGAVVHGRSPADRRSV